MMQAPDRLQEMYDAFKRRSLRLDLTRGKPSSSQLDLSTELLSFPVWGDYLAESAVDCRNCGGLQGLAEARRFPNWPKLPKPQRV
jgi:Aspartate amino-transferase